MTYSPGSQATSGNQAGTYAGLAKNILGQLALNAIPFGLGNISTQAIREFYDRPTMGQLAQLGGRPVLWGGENYGWQSPESFAQAFGTNVLKQQTGFTGPGEVYSEAAKKFGPLKAAEPKGKGTITPGAEEEKGGPDTSADIDTETPAKKDPYPTTTIPQEQDPSVTRLIDLIERRSSPEAVAEIEGMRLQNLLKSQLLTSELTRQGERARYARDIEKANIDAWKERQVAMYNANAALAAGLGAATMAAFAPPSASAMSATLSAAMQPFSNISFKRG